MELFNKTFFNNTFFNNTFFNNTIIFFSFAKHFRSFSSTARRFHQLQVENCDSNSRLVVDENDNGKFGFERVLPSIVILYVKLSSLHNY